MRELWPLEEKKGVGEGSSHTAPSHKYFTTPGGSTSDPWECLRLTDRSSRTETSEKTFIRKMPVVTLIDKQLLFLRF